MCNVREPCYGLAPHVGGSENAFSCLIQQKLGCAVTRTFMQRLIIVTHFTERIYD